MAESLFEHLPDELVCHVISFLHPFFETQSLRCVSRRFCVLVREVRDADIAACELALTQSVSWEPYEHTGSPPRARWAHSMTRVGDVVYLFGGSSHGAFLFYNDVFSLNLQTHTWSRVATSGTPPHPRGFATLLPFCSFEKLVVFGGQFNTPSLDGGHWTDGRWSFFSDTFVLDLKSLSWEPLVTSGTHPHPRVGHRAVTRGDSTLLMFGGTFVEYDQALPNGNAYRYFNDVFDLDLRTGVWRQLQTTGTLPSPRHSPSIVEHGGRLFVFGGNGDVARNESETFNDLHALDLSSLVWQRLETSVQHRPEPAWCCSSLLIGNCWAIIGGFPSSSEASFGALAVLDLSTQTWISPAVSGRVPPSRLFQAGVFAGDGWLMFGGSKGLRDFGDTSLLRLRTRPDQRPLFEDGGGLDAIADVFGLLSM